MVAARKRETLFFIRIFKKKKEFAGINVPA